MWIRGMGIGMFFTKLMPPRKSLTQASKQLKYRSDASEISRWEILIG